MIAASLECVEGARKAKGRVGSVCLGSDTAVAAPMDRLKAASCWPSLRCSAPIAFFVLPGKDSYLCLQVILEMFRLRRTVRAPKQVVGLVCLYLGHLSVQVQAVYQVIKSDVALQAGRSQAVPLKCACLVSCLQPDPRDGNRACGSDVSFARRQQECVCESCAGETAISSSE